MGLRMWWTQLVQRQRPERPRSEGQVAPPLSRAEQDREREARRQAALSAEDRDWEQASQERERERQDRAHRATRAEDR
jgi:hypothetical protein